MILLVRLLGNRGTRAALRPDRATLAGFVLLVCIGGGNAVAVRFSNLELPPFWGAGLRFAMAAPLFWILATLRRTPLPRGRALTGALVYGLLMVGVSYALAYWGFVRVQAGLAMAILATVPLMTVFLAWAHGLELLRRRGVLGAVISAAGLWVGIAGEPGAAVPGLSVLALVGSAAFMAEATVLLKSYPPSDPLAANAVALTTGVPVLLGLSLLAREPWSLPAGLSTWLAFAYLVTFGSVGQFYLNLWVLGRWTASATAYSNLLMPVATSVIAPWLAKEPVTMSFVLGGGLLLAGVWLGAIGGSSPADTAVRILHKEEQQ
jgi:drug/metabolite transporter (DMT)-like permease